MSNCTEINGQLDLPWRDEYRISDNNLRRWQNGQRVRGEILRQTEDINALNLRVDNVVSSDAGLYICKDCLITFDLK